MRHVLPGIAGALLLVAGGAVGWLAGTRGGGAARPATGAEVLAVPDGPADGPVGIAPAAQPVEGAPGPGTRYRAGHPELLEPAPGWEEWKYPNSRVHSAALGGTLKHLGDLQVGGVDRVALVSPDDFDQVWAFYKGAVERKVSQNRRPSAALRREGGAGQPLTVTIFDNPYACAVKEPESDRLQARGFWVHSLRYNLAGFLYRARGEEATGILLMYRPNSEFIGLLKEKLVKE